jgi:hypothetical protein
MGRDMSHMFKDAGTEVAASEGRAGLDLGGAEVEEKPRFSMSAWCVLPAVAAIALVVLFPGPAQTEAGIAPVKLAISMAVLLVWALAVSFLCYLICNRSRVASSLAFSLVLMALAMPRVFTPSIAAATAAEASRLTNGAVDVEKANKTLSAVANVAGKASLSGTMQQGEKEANHAEVTSATLAQKRFDKTLAELVGQFEQAQRVYERSGGDDTGTVRKREQLNQRISDLGSAIRAQAALAMYLTAADKTFSELLLAEGCEQKRLAGEMQHFAIRRGEMLKERQELCQAYGEAMSAAKSRFTLLRDRFGSWQVKDPGGQMVFQTSRDAEQFENAGKKLVAAREKIAELLESGSGRPAQDVAKGEKKSEAKKSGITIEAGGE